MQRVRGYPVPKRAGRFSLNLPKEAQILSVHALQGRPQLWALVDPHARAETRKFLLVVNGTDITEEVIFIGTVDVRGMPGHVFEITEQPD